MSSMKRIFGLVVLLEMSLCVRSLGQEQNTQKILFHVTAVRSEDARDICTSDTDCSATRFTVEGYSEVNGDTTDYVLECVEITAFKPSPHLAVVCDRLHVHNDYSARLMADAIAFGEAKPHPHSTDGPGESAYRILSEKEASKKK